MTSKTIDSVFDSNHHGDEVIITHKRADANGPSGNLIVRVKVQTGYDEFRAYKFTFQSQTQMERLFPALMKGLKP